MNVARPDFRLLARDVEIDRVRRQGAGSKPLENEAPEVIATIEAL